MNALIPMLAATAVAALASNAIAASPASNGALPVPANRIVGLWSNVATTGPCGVTPVAQGRQTLTFSAGGTFLDNPRFPPNGLADLNGIPGTHQRSIGIGTWDYNPRTGQYTVHQQFDWYVNNAYHGYQTVRRDILLSNDGEQAAGSVQTVRYAASGAIVAELCGSAVSTRI